MTDREISRALFVITRHWAIAPDDDPVAAETGASQEECSRIWAAIWEARAAQAVDFLKVTATSSTEMTVEGPGVGVLTYRRSPSEGWVLSEMASRDGDPVDWNSIQALFCDHLLQSTLDRVYEVGKNRLAKK
jgi:hypothetical protein